MTRPKRKRITLKDPDYQPGKAELEEVVKLDIPGKTTEEKLSNLAKAVTQPVEIRYQK